MFHTGDSFTGILQPQHPPPLLFIFCVFPFPGHDHGLAFFNSSRIIYDQIIQKGITIALCIWNNRNMFAFPYAIKAIVSEIVSVQW